MNSETNSIEGEGSSPVPCSASSCCGSGVRVAGGRDGTNWHECRLCGKPCDAVASEGLHREMWWQFDERMITLRDKAGKPFGLLMAQIATMRDRAKQYAEECEAMKEFECAHRHRSVEGTLNELLRLGNHFNEQNTR